MVLYSAYPRSLPWPLIWHYNLEAISLLGDTTNWSEIVITLTTEFHLTLTDIDNLEVRELIAYLEVCNARLAEKIKQHKKLEQELEASKRRRR